MTHAAWARPISGKIVHIWMSFPEISLCHAPEFFEYHFSTKCWIDYAGWVFQKSACVMLQNSKIYGWMSFPEIGLAHVPENSNKG